MIDRNFVEQCLKEALLLQGKCISLSDEKLNIVKKVEDAKKWLNKQPDYVNFLKHLQSILHQKNIGAFSELLSYFVQDVLNKDKEIILDLYTYHNLPALKIEAMNNGKRENIYNGSGGSIANIVSTGLRLIALSRLSNRKFIILDEPDCWLEVGNVPLFAKIIGDISSQLNIQTVIISHHHWSYFKDYGRVIELKKEGEHLTTEIIHDTPLDENYKPKDIIEKITLNKFMSHYDTSFELHPHLTCIIGKNDIGKSVLPTAMRALSYGDSDDSYIMHHEKEAQVLVEVSGRRQFLWQRFLQTDQDNPQKVKFSFFINNTLQQSEFSAYETPLFIQKELNICTTEDIDVHIGHQKQPVFLLSNETKPQQRAKILSLGKESLTIQKMMENIKTKTRQYKQIVKEGEERFSVIEKQLAVLENIHDIVNQVEKLKEDFFIFEKHQQDTEELKNTIALLEEVESIANLDKIDIDRLSTPVLNDTTELSVLVHELEINSNIADLDKIQISQQDIKLHPVSDLQDLIKELSKVEQITHISSIIIPEDNITLQSTQEIERAIELISLWEKLADVPPIALHIEEPKLFPVEDLIEFIKQLEDHEHYEADLLAKKQHLEKWEIKLAKENQELLTALGGLCPTCQQPITEEHIKGGLHA